ncbi:hypothetical protein Q3G72_033241 [Acer saccharum]|nr:hypothetical protein Q3G72_033241 [Acer saccharum]
MATDIGGSAGGGCCGYLFQVISGRWFMMFASFLIMVGADTCKDFGANVCLLSGLLAEVAPPWFMLLVGSVMNFAGYFMIWLALMKKISKPKHLENNTLLGSIRDNYLLFLISLHHRNQNRILKSNTKAHTKRTVNAVVQAFCGLGCSLTSMDNLGQIGESLGYKQHTINTFVRVFAGFVSEIILKIYKIPRPMIMALSLLLSALSNILIAYPFSSSVYIASVLVGFSYGAQLTLLFIIISELFGLKYYSTLFNCGQLASPLGSYVPSVVVVGKLYDKEAFKQLAEKGMTRAMMKELTCIGK